MYPRKRHNGYGSKFFKKDSVMQYHGVLNHNNSESGARKNMPSFQINRFKEIVSLRFNREFIEEVLEISNSSKSEVINGLLKDIEELLNNSENECFVSECYHVGKISNCIYINMNNKCCTLFFEYFSSLNSFPPHVLAFKQRLEKMSVQGKMHDSKNDFEDDYEYADNY